MEVLNCFLEWLGLLLYIHICLTALFLGVFNVGYQIAFKGDDSDVQDENAGLGLIVTMSLISLFFVDSFYVYWVAFTLAIIFHFWTVVYSFLMYVVFSKETIRKIVKLFNSKQ